MPFGLAVAAYGAYEAKEGQKDAARSAANQSRYATDAAIGEQQAAREQAQANIAPYLGQGTSALATLSRLNAGDMTAFQQDPGYQFALDQALESVRNRGAAAGNYGGGGTSADLIRFATGTAQQGYGDFYNRLFNQAQLGQNAAVGAGSSGINSASNIGNLLTANATNQGNAAINSANANSNLYGQLGTLAGNYFGGGGGFNFGGSPGPVTTQQIAVPNSGVNVSNVPVTGRIYG